MANPGQRDAYWGEMTLGNEPAVKGARATAFSNLTLSTESVAGIASTSPSVYPTAPGRRRSTVTRTRFSFIRLPGPEAAVAD